MINNKTENNIKVKDIDTLHIPVLFQESIDSLHLKEGDIVVDCTVNRGGHAEEIVKKIGKNGTLVIFDLDLDALDFAKERLENLKSSKIISFHTNYRNIKEKLEEIGINKVNAIFADLGLSSQELEISGRGFTFQKDEPLLMTFQSSINEDTLTARDLLNDLNASQLSDIIKNYGDETKSKKIAEKIVETRENLKKEGHKIETTGQLVNIIIEAVGHKPWMKSHPATKTFQALRIAVNDEYDGIRQLIDDGFEILDNGGFMSIITFHGGEDTIVKYKFNELKKQSEVKIIKKIKPGRDEVTANRRSRSAILRSIEK
jgi:16S rRNA (cytosine1402-N4)-methyltransferase